MARHKPYRINRTEDGKQFVVRTIAPNGKILASSGAYKRRRSAYANIRCLIRMTTDRLPLEVVPLDIGTFVEDLS